MSVQDSSPPVFGSIGQPTYDYKGGITHLWNNPEAVLEMSQKFAVQTMGEPGKDSSVVTRIGRSYRLAQTESKGVEWYLARLQEIFDGRVL